MGKIKKHTVVSSIFLAVFSLYMLSGKFIFAAAEDEPGSITRPNFLPGFNAGSFISGLVGVVIIVAFIAAFVYLLWGGFQWITSGGDEAGITAARGRIIQALIGLTVVVAAWAIFSLVQSAFGITILGRDLGPLFRGLFNPGS